MIRSLWISKTGLDAQQTNMDVTANNLANVSTNGFKRSRAVFEDLLYQTVRQPGALVRMATCVLVTSGTASIDRRRSANPAVSAMTDHKTSTTPRRRTIFRRPEARAQRAHALARSAGTAG